MNDTLAMDNYIAQCAAYLGGRTHVRPGSPPTGKVRALPLSTPDHVLQANAHAAYTRSATDALLRRD